MRRARVAAEHSQAFGADVTHVYRNALKGYSARIDEAQLGALRADKRVAYIERDQVVTIDSTQNPGHLGARPHRPGEAAARQQLHLHEHGRGRDRLRHRHRHPHHAQGVRRARLQRVRRRRRRRTRRLQRPRDPRRGDDRWLHLRGRQGRHARGRARPRLRRLGHLVRGHRRHRLGDGQPQSPGGRQHEPGGGASTAVDNAVKNAIAQRGHIRHRGRQLQRRRLPLLTRPRA